MLSVFWWNIEMAACRVASDRLKSITMPQSSDHLREPDSQSHALSIQLPCSFNINKHPLAVLGLLMLLQTLLIIVTANATSATFDEPAHLAAGVSYYELHNFGLYRVNPPLVRLVAALPSYCTGCKTNWNLYHKDGYTRSEFGVGKDFANANGERFPHLVRIGRYALIPFALLGLAVCFQWSKQLWGVPAAVVSGSLWTFSPYVIGHGSLITCDVPGASVGVLAAFLFWRWLQRPSGLTAVLCGIAWGFALLTKSTWVLFLPVWMISAWVAVLTRTTTWRPAIIDSILVASITLTVLNLGYGLHGTGTPLGDIPLRSRWLAAKSSDEAGRVINSKFSATWAGAIPIPIPDDFVRGCDLQAYDFEHIRGGYMAGTESTDGRWYYVFYAMLIKLPDATLLLCVLSLLSGIAQLRRAWLPLLTGMTVLSMITASVRMDDHSRYAISCLPFLFVWLGSVVSENHRKSRWRCSVVAGLCLWGGISTLMATPNTLAFANQISGGRTQLHRHLLGSEFDWGQDLVALRNWSETHNIGEPIHLLYCGLNDPSVYGVRWSFPNEFASQSAKSLTPGWYAVSPNVLYRETGFRVFGNPQSTEEMVRSQACKEIRNRSADFVVGAGMHVYRVE